MSMPWKCPDCKTWLAPGVKEHRCGDGPAPVVAAPSPVPFSGGTFIVPTVGTNWNKCEGCGAYWMGQHACMTYVQSGQTWSGTAAPGNATIYFTVT